MPSLSARLRRPSLTTWILVAVVLGVLIGLFLGDVCARLQPIAGAYIGLLQMTVLPYVLCALVSSIGGLTPSHARGLVLRAVAVLLLLWSAAIVVVVLLPLGLPAMRSGSFFSTSLLEDPERVDFLKLYIPANPFNALANSLVPAVVLFSISVGVALIGTPGKERLIAPLLIAVEALGRVTRAVVKLTPIGVFAMAASAAGTLTPDELGRLQGFLILNIGATLILALWLLPMLASALTPATWRGILGENRDALVTAFVTDNVFIVLPLLVEGVQRILARLPARPTGETGVEAADGDDRDGDDEDAARTAEVAVPVAYTFPDVGKLLTMLFIPFAAWFVGSPLDMLDMVRMTVIGVPAYFGKVSLAMPFLLDAFRLPADLFQLFLVAGIACGRFGSLVAAMHLIVFTLLVSCATTGRIRVDRRALVVALLGTAIAVVVVVVGCRARLSAATSQSTSKEYLLRSMQLGVDPTASRVLDAAAPNPVAFLEGEGRLDRVRRRGVLRVGYRPEMLPLSFRNDAGALVGHDVELAHRLALDLGVAVEFVPFGEASPEEQLRADHFDLAISGIGAVLEQHAHLHVSAPYLWLTPALVVPDHERRRFDEPKDLADLRGVRIGVPESPSLERFARDMLPTAEFVAGVTAPEFIRGEAPGVDGALAGAETAYAWTLLHPEFAVVVIPPGDRRVPVGFLDAGDDPAFVRTIDAWIGYRRDDGTLDRAYRHWILGRGAEAGARRWCIARDVLGWME